MPFPVTCQTVSSDYPGGRVDMLNYPVAGQTVSADYHSGGKVWNINTSAYETWTDANYNAGHYSVAAPAEGGGISILSGVVLNSTTSVTVASTSGLTVGQSVTGSGIPAGTTIVSISSSTVFILTPPRLRILPVGSTPPETTSAYTSPRRRRGCSCRRVQVHISCAASTEPP